MQHRDNEGRVSAQAGRRWHSIFKMGKIGAESFVSPCLATRKASKVLGFQECKKRLKEWQEAGRDKWQGRERS